MPKVKHDKWIKGIKGIVNNLNTLRFPSKAFYAERSEHGKSTGTYQCPCCDTWNDVYLWSFSGSGKRCSNCNVLMTSVCAILDEKDIVASKININDYTNETN
jgi:hypothetical protein